MGVFVYMSLDERRRRLYFFSCTCAPSEATPGIGAKETRLSGAEEGLLVGVAPGEAGRGRAKTFPGEQTMINSRCGN